MPNSYFSSNDDIDALAHDLNGPLGLLLPSLAVLRDYLKTTTDPQMGSVVQEAYLATQRQQLLLDNLLDYFRLLGKDSVRIHPEVCDISDVIEQYRQEFVQSHIKVEFQIDSEPIWLETDRYWLKRMMMALVDNALRFCTAHNHILIRPFEYGFEVADTGRPVLPNTAKDLWTFQQQFEIRQQGGRTSVGFNLPFVAAMAERLGGVAQVRQIDGWTVFRVQFA